MADRIYRVLNLVDDLFDRLFSLHPLPRSADTVDRLWFGMKVILAYILYTIWAALVVMIAISVLAGIWAGIPVAFETFISAF